MNTHSQSSYAPPVFTDKERVVNIKKALPKIQKIYQDFARKNHLPAYAFGIMVDGQLIYADAQGQLNIKTQTPASPQSMFRIASMSKSFTAMAILQLRDAGKLQLDDAVVNYIPEFKNQNISADAPTITIRHLLTHSAGFPTDDHWADRQLNMSLEDFIHFIKQGISFSNVPGTTYEYSNVGYALLGLIINRVSGMPYQQYIAENIWQPLNMTDVGWEISKVPSQQLALGYRWLDGNWQEEPMLSDGAFSSMGGIISSINTFSQYMALHQKAWPPRDETETGPIKRSSLREMHQAQRMGDTPMEFTRLDGSKCSFLIGYGYGLKWLRDCQNRTFVGHSGGLPGFGSNWLIMPSYGVGAVFFANHTYAKAADANLQALDTLINEAHLKPLHITPNPLLQQRQKQLVTLLSDWRYENAKGVVADNFFLDDALTTRQKQTTQLLEESGKIIRVHELVPDNQLKAHFIMEGEKGKLLVQFMLSPQKMPLIQEIKIEKL